MMREPADEGRLNMFLTTADVRALHLEKLVSEQCATGNGGGIIPQVVDGPTGRFKREELGLGWGEHPSIISVQATVRADNRKRRDDMVLRENKLVRALLADAKKRKLRSFVKPVEAARGCTGCVSCVPETRLRPRRSPDPIRPRTFMPASDVRRLERAAIREERAASAERRQLELEQLRDQRDLQQANALEQRRQRRAGARADMTHRRNEQRLVRAIVRRNTGGIYPNIK